MLHFELGYSSLFYIPAEELYNFVFVKLSVVLKITFHRSLDNSRRNEVYKTKDFRESHQKVESQDGGVAKCRFISTH